MNLKYLIILGYFSLMTGCEAPRDNPLDPDSEDYSLIEGSVQSFSLPYTPIKDVSVYWAPSKAFVKTDVNGKFFIGNASQVQGYIVFEKPTYRTDSVLVQWNSNKAEVHMNLNKLPVMDSSFIYTTVINHPDETQSFELLMDVKITDEDKDIDSVIVENVDFKLRQQLEYDIVNKNYQLAVSSEEMNLTNIEDIIGEDFTFYVSDIFGNIDMVGKDHVTRIISTGASIISPDNNTSVDSLPVLKWNRYMPGYTLTYTVDVFKNDPTNPQLVYRKTGITQDVSSIKVSPFLNPGDYFWVIWTIDSFKNSCRSKPAAFNIR